jgi:hypothetical protein
MRDDLIAAKGEVQARLGRVRRELVAAQGSLEAASGLRRRFLERHIAALQAEAERLMAEEARIRSAIDRAPR